MDYTKDMETACELLHEQLGDLIRKIKNNGMSTGDLEKLDKLTHSLKSVKGTMQMEEADGYSGMYPDRSYRSGDGNYSGMRGQRRDSMGRYSGGYSMNGLTDKLRELMQDAPDDHTRRKIQRLIEDMDN